jgi:ATP synthase F1 delta subunit
MEEIAEVYARALFEVAQERDALDEIHDELGQFADALNDARDAAVFFFSPYFSTEEKKDGLHRMISGADPAFMNFLEALIERHRMPAIFRIRSRFEEMWDEEKKLLPVEVTSAVELDQSTVKRIGDRIGEQTGTTIELTTVVNPDILGGIVLRVGNFVLDASIKNRLEQLRKQVAQA